MAKRLLCVILSIMLVVAMMPVGVVAEDENNWEGYEILTSTGGELSTGYYYLTKDITLTTDISITAGNTVVIDLNGHTLTGTGTSSVITVNGTLTINDNSGNNSGKITGGTGTKEIVAGQSDANRIHYVGGGIYVGEGGSLTLNAGTISGNELEDNAYEDSNSGAGVYVYCAQFTMNGGIIAYNTSGRTSSGAGVYVKGISGNRSTFTMNNGSISYNSCGYGTGITLNGYTDFYMNGGTISYNTSNGVSPSYACGGVSIIDYCNFYMYGGSICNNTTNGYGGGVFVRGLSGKFYMNGGTITENSAQYGGGVAMNGGKSGQKVEIYSGAIYGNTATTAGADIYRKSTYGSITFDIQANEMTADGMDFTSYVWYTDASGSRYSASNANEYTITTGSSITSSLSLIAASATPTYTLTYDSNGGEGTVTDDTAYEFGKTATVASGDSLTYDGYTFSGWNTASDGTGDSYAAGSAITITADTTLYAVWTADLADTWVEYTNMRNGYDLAVGFYIPKSKLSNDGSYTVKITATVVSGSKGSWTTTKETVEIPASAWSSDSVGETDYWVVIYEGIWAMQYMDEITVDIYDSNGDKVCESYTDSINAYETRYIAKYSTDADAVALANALLSYCSAAKTYYAY